MNTRRARVDWVDVAKGFAMLAIVMGHFDIGYIDRLVYSWHVPFFFVVAGFFLSQKDLPLEFAVKKAKALLIPFALTATAVVFMLTIREFLKGGDALSAFLRSLASALYGSGSMKGATAFGISNIGAIWFLEALFWAILLVRFTNVWIIGVLAVVAWYSARFVWLPLNLQSGALAALYVYLGQRLFQKTELMKKTNWPLFTLGVVSFISCAVFNPPTFFVKNICSPLSIVFAAFIVYFLLTVIRWLAGCRIADVIRVAIGNHTLAILCLHSFQLKCFSWNGLCAMISFAHGGGRLPFYILFLLVCNAVYFYVGVLLINAVSKLMMNHIQKGLI